MIDVMLQKSLERERTWLLIDKGEHIGIESALHGCVFVEHVEDAFRIGVAFEFDVHTHTLAVGFVAYFRDAVDFLVTRHFGDLFDQFRFIDLVGQFGDDDAHATAFGLFEVRARAYDDAPAPVGVGVADTFAPLDDAPGGEVGSAYDTREVFGGGIRIIDQIDDAVADLDKIMRRYIGCHADGDAGRAVQEQVR